MSRPCVVREGSAVSSLGPLRRPLLDNVDGDSGYCSLRFCTIFKYLFLRSVLISGAIFFVRNKKLLIGINYYEHMNMVKRWFQARGLRLHSFHWLQKAQHYPINFFLHSNCDPTTWGFSWKRVGTQTPSRNNTLCRPKTTKARLWSSQKLRERISTIFFSDWM